MQIMKHSIATVIAALLFIRPIGIAAYERTVLIEDFTSVNCGLCVDIKRPALLSKVNVGHGALSIRYHFNNNAIGLSDDPFADADEAGDNNAQLRISWYEQLVGFVAPLAVKVDGRVDVPVEATDFDTEFASRKALESPVSMSIIEDRSDLTNIGVSVEVMTDVALQNHRLLVAVVARFVELPDLPQQIGNPNAPTEFHNVMLTMLPNALGTELAMNAGSMETLDYSYAMGAGELWPQEAVYIVAFIQDMLTGEVLQAASNLPSPAAVTTEISFPDGATTLTPMQTTSQTEISITNTNADGLEVRYALSVEAQEVGPQLQFDIEPAEITIGAGETASAMVNIAHTGTDHAAGRVMLKARPIAIDGRVPLTFPDAATAPLAAMTEGVKFIIVGEYGIQPATSRAYLADGLLASDRYPAEDIFVTGNLFAWTLETFAAHIDLAIIPLRYDDITTQDVVQWHRLTGPYLAGARAILDQGGKALIFSHNSCSWSLAPSATPEAAPTRAFLQDIFELEFGGLARERLTIVGQNGTIRAFALQGFDGDPIGDGFNVPVANFFDQVEWPMYDAYTDMMRIPPGAKAQPVVYSDNDPLSIVGVRAADDNNGSRAVYFGFGLEALRDQNDRVGLLERSIDWLLHGATSVADDTPGSDLGSVRLSVHPIADQTQISFEITSAERQRVRISIYDVVGREIAVLYDSYAARGVHTTPFDASRLQPGVYFAHMQTDVGRITRKFVRID